MKHKLIYTEKELYKFVKEGVEEAFQLNSSYKIQAVKLFDALIETVNIIDVVKTDLEQGDLKDCDIEKVKGKLSDLTEKLSQITEPITKNNLLDPYITVYVMRPKNDTQKNQ